MEEYPKTEVATQVAETPSSAIMKIRAVTTSTATTATTATTVKRKTPETSVTPAVEMAFLCQKKREKSPPLPTLKEDTWFNDEVINSYFQLLGKKYPNVGFLSSYFLVHSNSSHWKATQRVVQAFIAGQIEKIIFPYHTPEHWTCVAINGKDNVYAIFDSLGKSYTDLNALKEWLQDVLPERKFHFHTAFHVAHQSDWVNCGTYTCLYAKLLAQGKTIEEINGYCHSLQISKERAALLCELERECDQPVLISSERTNLNSELFEWGKKMD